MGWVRPWWVSTWRICQSRTGWPSAAGNRACAWRSNRSSTWNNSRSTSSAVACSARSRVSCSALSAATWPGSRWCRRSAPWTRRSRCTRCTATFCGPVTPRRRRCTWWSGSETAGRSARGGSAPFSTARPSSRCPHRSRPTRAVSSTRTRCRSRRRPTICRVSSPRAGRSMTPGSPSSPNGMCGSSAATR